MPVLLGLVYEDKHLQLRLTESTTQDVMTFTFTKPQQLSEMIVAMQRARDDMQNRRLIVP